MTGRRAIVGLCMLCALMISAIAAQSASAAGTTAVTCKEGTSNVGANQYKDAHCKEVDNTTPGKFGHFKIEPNTTTELEGSNKTTGEGTSLAVLVSTQAGVEEELQATVVEKKPGTSPWMENKEVGGEMVAHGEGQLTYTNVTVTKPAGKGCKAFGEGGEKTVATKQLTATTEKAGDGLVFKPAEGTLFAEFEIKECSVGALNGVYKAEGSLTATPEGATLVTTTAKVKEEGKLLLRGQKAGLGGSLTLEGRAKGSTGAYTPLSVTT